MIPVKGKSALRARMNTNAQRFLNPVSAIGAVLGRVRGIHLNELPPGTFSLVRQFSDEARPPHIVNLLGQNAFTKADSVDVLNGDKIVMADKVCRNLVLKIVSLAKDFLVHGSQYRDSFQPPIRTFLASSDTPLSDPKFPLCGLIEARVFDLRSVRESCKRFDTNVYTNLRVGGWKRLLSYPVARKDRKPFRPFAFNDHFLNSPINRSAEFDFQVTDQRQVEFPVSESIALAVVDDRIKESLPLESWEARNSSCFHAAKERLERLVELAKRLYHRTTLNFKIFRVCVVSYFWNLFTLIQKRNSNSIQLPSVSSFLEGCIVEISEQIERPFKSFRLYLCGINTEFVRASHTLIIANQGARDGD